MRSAWKGSIACGLLNIPVRLGTTVPTSSRSMFHQIHVGCGQQIEQKRRCPVHGDVDWGDVGKGAEVPGVDGLVEVTDDELEALRGWESKTAAVQYFCPAGQIPPLLRDQAYFVAAGWKDSRTGGTDGGAMRAAALLHAAMTAKGLAAVCRIGYATSDSLAVLEVDGGEFLMTKLWWPALLRSRDADTAISPNAVPRPQELKMAIQLLGTMTQDFDPDAHTDTYRDSVGELLNSKAAGGVLPVPTVAAAAMPVPDMTALLSAALADQKAKNAKDKTPARARARKAS